MSVPATNHNAAVKSGRRWLPWKSRTRSIAARAWDWVPNWGTSLGDDPISAVLGALLFIVVLPFMIPALLVSPFFLLESLLQWLVSPFVLVLRLTAVMSVPVWVKVGDQTPHEERVRGWRRAKARTVELRNIALANPSLSMGSATAMHDGDPYQHGRR